LKANLHILVIIGILKIMALQGRILMGGRFNSRDLYRDWRLDVDNMSYEVTSFSNNHFYYFSILIITSSSCWYVVQYLHASLFYDCVIFYFVFDSNCLSSARELVMWILDLKKMRWNLT